MYPTLLGINWEIDNHTIINFKKRILTFQDLELRVVAPIDSLEGYRYVEQVNSEGQGDYLDHIYNITYEREIYAKMSWKSISSCTLDSGEAFENWQNHMHEVSLRRCSRIT